MALQKGVLILNQKLTNELKSKIRSKINSPEGLEVRQSYGHGRKRTEEVVGHVVDIRYNDKKKTNTITVEVTHEHTFYKIDYNLHINWLTGEVDYVERW